MTVKAHWPLVLFTLSMPCLRKGKRSRLNCSSIKKRPLNLESVSCSIVSKFCRRFSREMFPNDFQRTWSKVKVLVIVQMLSDKYIFIWPLSLNVAKHGKVNLPTELMFHIDFQVEWWKVKVELLVFEKILSRAFCLIVSYSFTKVLPRR